MFADEISARVRRLIDASLATMDHVEMLLLLRAAPDSPIDLDQLPPVGYLDRTSAVAMLIEFEASGFVQIMEGGYRYAPSAADADAIDELSALYDHRPLALVQAIHARSAPFRPISDIKPRPDGRGARDEI